MNPEYLSTALAQRLTEVGVADADPLRVIISFEDRATSASFAAIASRIDSLVERYRLAVDQAVRDSAVAVAAVAPPPREHPSIQAVSVALPVGVIKALSDLGAEVGLRKRGIELDVPVRIALDLARRTVGVDRAQADGASGSGVRIAIVDTGIDATHPDLAGRVDAAQDFSGEGAGDQNGHGTHVAGIAAGGGRLLGGRYRGIAPGARLLDAKALGAYGGGSASGIISAIEWAVSAGALVLNLSVEGPASDGTDAMSRAADWAVDQGVVVCAAAGNHGPAPGTVSSPGAAPLAIAVAALDRGGGVAGYSARGVPGSHKPDVAAPGTIVSCKPRSLALPSPVGDYYREDSGTSMACPGVSGVCALLLERAPAASPGDVRAVLRRTAVDAGAPPEAQGAGRIDAWRALSDVAGAPAEPAEPAEPAQPAAAPLSIERVIAEVGLRPRTIGRVRIALENQGGLALSSCVARLATEDPEVTVLQPRGEYGEFAPGEVDDAAFVVEYGNVTAPAVPFVLNVQWLEGGAARRAQLTGELPVAQAAGVTAASAREEARDLLEREMPELARRPDVARFVRAHGLAGWGESLDRSYRWIEGAGGRDLLIVSGSGAPARAVSAALTRGEAAGVAERHARQRLASEPIAIGPIVPRETESGRPVWIVYGSVVGPSLRRWIQIEVDARTGEVSGSSGLAATVLSPAGLTGTTEVAHG